MGKKQRELQSNTDEMTVSSLSAEQLASVAKGGDALAFEEIAKRYEKIISGIAASFNVPASEREDLCQEGLIALYRAVLKYDDKVSRFSTFAGTCIKRAMLTWIRDHVSRKDSRGREIFELSALEDDELSLLCEDLGPEEIYLSKETVASLKKSALTRLSDYEKCVFLLYLQEMNAEEIAAALGRGRKSVENALDRIRHKLSEI